MFRFKSLQIGLLLVAPASGMLREGDKCRSIRVGEIAQRDGKADAWCYPTRAACVNGENYFRCGDGTDPKSPMAQLDPKGQLPFGYEQVTGYYWTKDDGSIDSGEGSENPAVKLLREYRTKTGKYPVVDLDLDGNVWPYPLDRGVYATGIYARGEDAKITGVYDTGLSWGSLKKPTNGYEFELLGASREVMLACDALGAPVVISSHNRYQGKIVDVLDKIQLKAGRTLLDVVLKTEKAYKSQSTDKEQLIANSTNVEDMSAQLLLDTSFSKFNSPELRDGGSLYIGVPKGAHVLAVADYFQTGVIFLDDSDSQINNVTQAVDERNENDHPSVKVAVAIVKTARDNLSEGFCSKKRPEFAKQFCGVTHAKFKEAVEVAVEEALGKLPVVKIEVAEPEVDQKVAEPELLQKLPEVDQKPQAYQEPQVYQRLQNNRPCIECSII